MSASSDGPPDPMAGAVLSNSLSDLLLPGVVIELDAGEAEDFGAFVETALTEDEAWAANGDLEAGEVADGE